MSNKARIIVTDLMGHELSSEWDEYSNIEIKQFGDEIGRILADRETGNLKITTDQGNVIFIASHRVHYITLEIEK
jgi:hypothetical protein